jgi:hypothetical protein
MLGNLISRLRGRPSSSPRNFVADFRRHVVGPLFRRSDAEQNV